MLAPKKFAQDVILKVSFETSFSGKGSFTKFVPQPRSFCQRNFPFITSAFVLLSESSNQFSESLFSFSVGNGLISNLISSSSELG